MKYDFTHLSHEEVCEMLSELLEYFDECQRVLGNWHITGRPVYDCIRDIREHYGELEPEQ